MRSWHDGVLSAWVQDGYSCKPEDGCCMIKVRTETERVESDRCAEPPRCAEHISRLLTTPLNTEQFKMQIVTELKCRRRT